MQGRHQSAGVEATYFVPHNSRPLFIRDGDHDIIFLVDIRSDCSFFPATKNERRLQPSQIFSAENGTHIQVFGQKLFSLDLGLRKKFVLLFYNCNISNAILGADFLHHFNLKPYLRNRALFDLHTN